MSNFKFHLLLIIVIHSANLYAQNLEENFGKAGTLKLSETYPNEKSAEAIVLFDVGKSYFVENSQNNGFDIIFERTTRIKILKKAGVKWAEVEVPYYEQGDIYEKVYDIAGFTYNVENSEIKRASLNTKQVYSEKSTEFWNNTKFVLPEVREGSIIEYQYKVSSPYKFNLRDWEFQWRIPVKYSEYTTAMIPFYTYTFILQGRNKLDVSESHEDNGFKRQFGSISFHDMIYKFGLKDIPAFTDEAYITSINDYIIKINFQLSSFNSMSGSKTEIMTTWPKMCNDLLKAPEFGKYISNAQSKGEKLLAQLNLNGKTNLEKLETIIDYVKQNYKWNDHYDIQTTKSIKQFVEEKSGNTANINLFLAGLLNAANIENYPVVISTRGHGKIRTDFPFLHFFNSIVIMAKIDSTLILTDATEPLCPFNKIPPQCLNEKGLIVKKNSSEWVTLVNTRISTKQYLMTFELTPNLDSLKGTFSLSLSEYDAINMRKKYLNSKTEFKKDLEKNGLHILDTVTALNLLNTKRPFVVSFNASYHVDTLNGQIIVLPFLAEAVTENPFKQINRTYPVDFTYANSKNFHSVFTIPAGYTIKRLPGPARMDNENYFFSYEAKKLSENSIEIITTYAFKKAVYDPDIFIGVKFFYDDIIRTINEPIVFEKI